PVRLLVVGAGSAGQSLVREIQADRLPAEPVGFLDDNTALHGTEVCGLPVLGACDDLVQVAREVHAEQVLLAIPSAGGRFVRRMVILSRRAGLPCRIVPGLRDIILGDVHFSQVRGVEPDHLLGRESVDFRDAEARGVVAGRTVLVTGAGGSIGGELCRRLLPLGPRELILLGRGENSIFEIAAELEPRRGDTVLSSVIADVRDEARLAALARRLRPDLILHAAAHKHVPLMEQNPEEAVLVNAGGTANLIRFARETGAERFVLISTDKAVEPDSVMGATKKIAEHLVRDAAARNGGPRFMIVRFGNVLGSRGSVVPFFMNRIRQGLPLPVTHPEMTRYFMTIKEAALLVIEAMVQGERGATYILEMGNPVLILELARNLLVLSGYDPAGGDDGPGIQITGLRPGERLHEALHEPHETLVTGDNPLIRRAEASGDDPARTAAALPALLALAREGRTDAMRDALADLLQRPALGARREERG
ncbi:MAG TPA: polysaccharide biosynthesis protein, partial [Thauera sp.]|nr:polysaccharide biosynthesis protein [Thauera sp.]